MATDNSNPAAAWADCKYAPEHIAAHGIGVEDAGEHWFHYYATRGQFVAAGLAKREDFPGRERRGASVRDEFGNMFYLERIRGEQFCLCVGFCEEFRAWQRKCADVVRFNEKGIACARDGRELSDLHASVLMLRRASRRYSPAASTAAREFVERFLGG